MTTPVNTFQDILDALERQPALRDQLRSYILTEELLQLPAQFLLLRADVDELKEGQVRLETRMDRLEEGQTRLETRMDRLEEGQTRLEASQTRLEASQTRLETRMDRLEGRFGNVEGHQYEQRVVSSVLMRCRLMGIERPRIALAQAGPVRQEFHDAMDDAISAGMISLDEYLDLGTADLIVRGGNRRHAVVEVSLGPDEDDISRAVRRSEILQRATSEQVTPVVVTPSPHPAFVQEAERRNTHVMDVAA